MDKAAYFFRSVFKIGFRQYAEQFCRAFGTSVPADQADSATIAAWFDPNGVLKELVSDPPVSESSSGWVYSPNPDSLIDSLFLGYKPGEPEGAGYCNKKGSGKEDPASGSYSWHVGDASYTAESEVATTTVEHELTVGIGGVNAEAVTGSYIDGNGRRITYPYSQGANDCMQVVWRGTRGVTADGGSSSPYQWWSNLSEENRRGIGRAKFFKATGNAVRKVRAGVATGKSIRVIRPGRSRDAAVVVQRESIQETLISGFNLVDDGTAIAAGQFSIVYQPVLYRDPVIGDVYGNAWEVQSPIFPKDFCFTRQYTCNNQPGMSGRAFWDGQQEDLETLGLSCHGWSAWKPGINIFEQNTWDAGQNGTTTFEYFGSAELITADGTTIADSNWEDIWAATDGFNFINKECGPFPALDVKSSALGKVLYTSFSSVLADAGFPVGSSSGRFVGWA
jgi:hypothetical protein